MYKISLLGYRVNDDVCLNPYWIEVKETADLEYGLLIASGRVTSHGVRSASKGRIVDRHGVVIATVEINNP